jgi:hypothetical protein
MCSLCAGRAGVATNDVVPTAQGPWPAGAIASAQRTRRCTAADSLRLASAFFLGLAATGTI